MKERTLFLLIISMIASFSVIGQAPQSFNYQAVARDATGAVLPDQLVAFRISILEGSAEGPAVYSETHAPVTNSLGLVNLLIGKGTIVSGEFEAINWGKNEHFIKVELDATGGTDYFLMGVSQLLSVPYSLSSKGLTLTSPDGHEYEVYVDNTGKMVTVPEILTCGSELFDTRDGQYYNTVQIGTQCWMAENLNIGTQINSPASQTDNGLIEKYCYFNLPCISSYGGLYQWDELMGYSTTEGARGICPEGWHVPTDAEWCTATTIIDPTVNCSAYEWSGTDAGIKMKSTSGWNSSGNGTNLSGFTAQPGGFYSSNGSFYSIGNDAMFWSSDGPVATNAWGRWLNNLKDDVGRVDYNKILGLSVRCVQDY